MQLKQCFGEIWNIKCLLKKNSVKSSKPLPRDYKKKSKLNPKQAEEKK